MARLFDDGVPHYIWASSAALAAVPITLACWFNSDDLTTYQTLLSIGHSAATNHYFLLYLAGAVAGDYVRAETSGGGGGLTANTTLGYSADTWHHAAGVFSAVDARSVFIDGGNKGTESTSVTPAGLDRTSMGAFRRSGAAILPMSGLIAEAAIWNIALSDAEVAILAAGYSPLLVRPQNLVFYAPLVREILDGVGGVALTNTGSTVGDHPRVLLPPPPSLVLPPAPAVTAIASQRLKIGVGR